MTRSIPEIMPLISPFVSWRRSAAVSLRPVLRDVAAAYLTSRPSLLLAPASTIFTVLRECREASSHR